MIDRAKEVVAFFKDVFKAFGEDRSTQSAAALAYYTVFSLPALLVVVIAIAGAVFGRETVENRVQDQIASLVGNTTAEQLQVMRDNADQQTSGNIFRTLLGVGTLVFGATGAFVHLQNSLNHIWEVEPDPKTSGIRNFITKRLLSFGMILTIAFLLLTALVVSAVLSAMGDYIAGLVQNTAVSVLIQVANFVLSFVIIAVLFALIFKVLPDAKASWRDVSVGAILTAVLFILGQIAIGLYFRFADVGSAFGAAGSLALVLVWIYYSAVILFFGAEFTQAWARRFGDKIVPEEGAVRVVRERRTRTA